MVVGRLCTGRHVGAWRFCLEVSLGKNSGDRGVVRKAVGDDQLRFRPDQTRPDQDRTGYLPGSRTTSNNTVFSVQARIGRYRHNPSIRPASAASCTSEARGAQVGGHHRYR